MKPKILICLILVFQTFNVISQNNQVCRTPGGTRTLVFNPCAWDIGNTSQPIWQTTTDQQYSYTEFIESFDPGSSPVITLNDFIAQMSETDLAILYYESHANQTLIGAESYSKTPDGLQARDDAYNNYLTQGINASFITTAEAANGYLIAVTDAGLDHWCQHLDQVIVYANACHSSGLNDNWHSLTSIGYNEEISGFAGADLFFERMNGIRNRGPQNSSRSVNDARSGINHLVVDGNLSVVLSPIVVDQKPRSYELVTEGQTGYVDFDCEMDMTYSPGNVVYITGNVGQLQNILWANNHRIEFTVSNLVQFSHVDFRIDGQFAVSAHNQSQLDGNCNPDQHNGVGPNGDFFNWTSLTSPYANMDFENGTEAAVIQSTIPGMQFITTEGYDWVYGDKTSGDYNIYPNGNANYWCNGNFFAWLGPNQGNGRINFTGATATSVTLGTSCYSGLYLEAYDKNDYLLDMDQVGGNLNTNILSTVTVMGAGIDHVLIHDEGNFWLIDDLCVVDLLQQTLLLLPENLAKILEKLETINPGATNNFIVYVNEMTDGIQLILNWLTNPKYNRDIQFQVTIRRPDNSIYQQFNTSSAPATVNIANPPAGYWQIDVKALQVPTNDFPIALVAGQEKRAHTDIYLSSNDILLQSNVTDSANASDLMIPVVVHSSLSSDSLTSVRVRCYIDYPRLAAYQIDNDDFWLNETPGSLDTVYFYLNPDGLAGSHQIYVLIDPDKELNESDTTNNLASKNLTILSLNEKSEQRLSLYPNPNNGIFSVEIKPLNSQGNLLIYNSSGKIVKIFNIDKAAEFHKTFNMKSLPEGSYYMKFLFEKGSEIKKFVVHKEIGSD